MRRVGPLAIALCLAVVSWQALDANGIASAQSSVYRSVDDKGNVTYSDRPSPGGKRVNVPPVQTYSTPEPRPPSPPDQGTPSPTPPVADESAKSESPDEPPAGYREVTIVSPENDAVIRSNPGDVTLGVRVEPELREGDTIAVLIDGKEFGEPSDATALTLVNVDRGTHILSVQVRGPDGEQLAESTSVTFHLLRGRVKRGG